MQIAIKFVNFPRVGSSGKYGSIVDQNGTKVMVPIDLLAQFRQGMNCEIATKTQTWGADQVTIATTGPLQPGQGYTGAVQNNATQAGYQGPNQYAGTQRANTGFQPRVVQGGGSAIGSLPQGHDQGRHIFVTGIVGRAMGSGKFAASEVPVLTQAACEAYDRVLSAPARSQLREPAQAFTGQNAPIEPPPPEQGDPGPVELQ